MPVFRLSAQPDGPLVEKLSTRITEPVEERLRLFVALKNAKIGDVVNAALDSQLPSLEELAGELERLARLTRDDCPSKTNAPGQPLTSKENR